MPPKFEYEYVTYGELYRAYLDWRKRKRTTYNALQFEIDENIELYRLWKELNRREYTVGKSIVFCIDNPVKREVFAADFRDRIVHHLVINRINGILEGEFIEDSYSCRTGKGTDYGIMKCREYMEMASDNYSKECYIAKCDLKSFFMTIDKEVLYHKLMGFIKENYRVQDARQVDFMEYIIAQIVFNEPQKNCVMKQSWKHWEGLPREKSLFSCCEGKGLPIGNLTSQIFANFYLSEFDHYVKDTLGIRYYGRYVDDFFIITRTRQEAREAVERCRDKLLSMGVTLHPRKLYVQPVSKGVKFIGAVIKPGRTYISNRTKGNLYWRLRQFSDTLRLMESEGCTPSLSDIGHFVASINSYLGFMVHYSTFNIRRKLIYSEFMRGWRKYCYNDPHVRKLTVFAEYTRHRGKKRHWDYALYYGLGYDIAVEMSVFRQYSPDNQQLSG